jgi:transcriptional antiterminator RfaH
MPILAAEPDLYPATLFDAEADGRAWSVAQTKARQEKALARSLVAAGVPYFSPCTPRRNRVRGHIVVSHIPLFAGYVFVRGAVSDRGRILTTGRAIRLLSVPDQDGLWADLRQVWHLTGTGLPLEPLERLVAGARVRIRRGPMAGLTGVIVRSAGRQRFVVAVDFLGKGVAVELETDTLARLPMRQRILEGVCV